eukprot:GHVL01034660.1.p1 GENE.GHVL01034660.1~~GHVL01034660.1.p1  ORF type:complete len:174 (+),score=22.68 GHVL01034660.1:179-700(+)
MILIIFFNQGRTRHVFQFDLGDHLSLVDLPGFGFARVPEKQRLAWGALIHGYFDKSIYLKRVISLIDVKEGIRELDETLWDHLIGRKMRFMVVLTKVDLLEPMQLHKAIAQIISKLQSYPEDLVWSWLHAVSARHLHGMQELRCSLSAIASDNRLQVGLRLSKPLEEPKRVHP